MSKVEAMAAADVLAGLKFEEALVTQVIRFPA